MTYLKANPLLKEPLKPEHVKDRLLGHWGASPGLAFAYIHLSRAIKAHDLDVVFMAGPGHGAPGVLGPCYLEGSYSEIYPDCSEDEEGLLRFFKQFSFPGGIGSHCTPETPGSIHEGGELGYVLSHACGAAFDNPDLIVAAVVGDGESETGPLATSWHINKFLNPIRDGAVLPILHLNGYKINNPTIWARVRTRRSRRSSAAPAGRRTSSKDPTPRRCTRRWPRRSTSASPTSAPPRSRPAISGKPFRPRWPMIVLRTPKGWTSPAEVGGHKLEGSWRAHQVPMADVKKDPARLKQLEDWMRSYKPEELFDDGGPLPAGAQGDRPDRHAAHRRQPARQRRASEESPAACPTSASTAIKVEKPGTAEAENCRPLGVFLRDVMKAEHAELPRLRPGREHVEQAQRDLRGLEETLARGVLPRGRRRDGTRPGRPRRRDAQRAHAGRHAGRLPADRPAWVLQHLRGVRPRHRLDVQPARQVADHLQPPVVAGEGRVAEPAHHLDRLAAGPQRLHAPGSRASSTSS